MAKKMTPATNDDSADKKLIALAKKAALERLLNGTASSQLITHLLEVGSLQYQINLEKSKQQTLLLEAKTRSETSKDDAINVASEALQAFKRYSPVFGHSQDL